jgi:hypothetical protein
LIAIHLSDFGKAGRFLLSVDARRQFTIMPAAAFGVMFHENVVFTCFHLVHLISGVTEKKEYFRCFPTGDRSRGQSGICSKKNSTAERISGEASSPIGNSPPDAMYS